jgi:hypothetical protein
MNTPPVLADFLLPLQEPWPEHWDIKNVNRTVTPTMKILISSILSLFIVSSLLAQADITPRVTDALKKSDAAALSALMMNPVELSIPGVDGSRTAAEARTALASFFSAHQVREFTVKHQGTSKLDDQYRIGDLVTSKGTFRVTFFMKKSATAMQIKQLKIESPDDF